MHIIAAPVKDAIPYHFLAIFFSLTFAQLSTRRANGRVIAPIKALQLISLIKDLML